EDMIAQVCVKPATIAATPLVRPVTSVGTLRSTVEPSPTWPLELPPQHFTPPPLVRAHTCRSPAVIAVTPLERPVTSRGVVRLPVETAVLPRKLLALYPQHFTPPPVVSAQVWYPPEATDATFSSGTSALAGMAAPMPMRSAAK